MKRQTTKALADWQADELRKELEAKGQPPAVPDGWFTMRGLAAKLNTSERTAQRLIAANVEAGKMLVSKHAIRYPNGVVRPTFIYRLASGQESR